MLKQQNSDLITKQNWVKETIKRLNLITRFADYEKVVSSLFYVRLRKCNLASHETRLQFQELDSCFLFILLT